MNCSVSPLATDGLAGLTAIDVNAAAVDGQRVVGARDPAQRAVIAVVPVARAEARPLAEIVATERVPTPRSPGW